VEQRIGELAAQVAADYAGKAPVFVGILNGAVPFMMELLGRLPEKLLEKTDYDFLKVSSYSGRFSTGRVKLDHDTAVEVSGRDVLVVDGIVDTGRTLEQVLSLLQARRPRSLRVCTLLDKSARRERPVRLDYCGFSIENVFVVGYGLDCDQRGRALRCIAAVD
jgi:hypoxanthine phosphoribosyltransferase